jgi:signal transduction histidine kinase
MLRPWLREPRLVPWIAAPVMALLAVNEALLDDGFRPYASRIFLVAALLAAGFLVAAHRPSVGAVVVAGFYPLGQALGVPGPGGAGLIAVLVAMAWAGYGDAPARSRWALAGVIVVFVGTDIAVQATLWDKIFFCVIFVPAWWLGTLVRREQVRSRQLAELAAALDAQREASAHAAVVEERARIAREVHDAVAHSVSVMTLQIGGLRRQLDAVLADRPTEREVMLGLERLGRQSVDELRTLVGILRDDTATEGRTSTAPEPSLARVADLVADVRAAGLPVELSVRRHDGAPDVLPPSVDVSAYRIVQEALTNVLRHAPGSTTRVDVEHGATAVTVLIEDDGAGAGTPPPAAEGTVSVMPRQRIGGNGLVGMRERVAVHGGTLEAGPSGSGFRVRASFPVTRRWS